MQVRILSISFANLYMLKRVVVTQSRHGMIVMDPLPGMHVPVSPLKFFPVG